MNPQIVEIDAFDVWGIKTTTTNKDEMNPESAKIAKLWNQFEENIATKNIPGQDESKIVMGVYTDFADEDRGEYKLVIGKKVILPQDDNQINDLDKVNVLSGKYLRFTGEGAIPDIVIETWGKIWEYFNSASEYSRSFGTDFEKYDSNQASKIEIYISIL